MVITSASDLVFKTITSGTYGKIILEAILKTIFKKKVIIKRYLNVELPKEAREERGKRLDLLIETNIGFINIEVNNNDYDKEKIVRNFMYLCEFLVQNVKKGKSYNLDTDYIQLNINFGDKIKSNYIITNGKIINEERVLVENFKILGLSIANLYNLCYNDNELINRYKYILMLDKTIDELVEFYPDDEIIGLYGGELMRLNSNADFVRLLTNEQEQELYENTIREESYKEGVEQEKEKFIRNLKGVLPISQIAKVANVSQEKVKKILMM